LIQKGQGGFLDNCERAQV